MIIKAALLADRGDVSEAVQTIDEVRQQTQKLGRSNVVVLQFYSIARVHVLLAAGEYSRAVSLAEENIAAVESSGLLLSLPTLLMQRGQAEAALGRHASARESFSAAYNFAKDRGIRRLLWPILVSWSETEAEVGDYGKREELAELAKIEIEFIFNQLDDKELREAFTAHPQVGSIIRRNI